MTLITRMNVIRSVFLCFIQSLFGRLVDSNVSTITSFLRFRNINILSWRLRLDIG